MPENILVTLPLTAGDHRYVEERKVTHNVRFANSRSVGEEDLGWADIVLGNLAPPNLLLRYPNIRWLHSPHVAGRFDEEMRQHIASFLNLLAGRPMETALV